MFSHRLRSLLYKCKPSPFSMKIVYSRPVTLLSTKVENEVIKKWARFWEDLFRDYSDVLKETVEQSKRNPKKTLAFSSWLVFSYVCFQTNPDELSYRDAVVQCSNDVLLVAKTVRNPRLDQYLTSIETCYNLGVIRRLSLGVISFIWLDNYSSELGIFKTNCGYLKPEYLTFFNRIIDVGFLGKWWKLDFYMEDYDINSDEWNT